MLIATAAAVNIHHFILDGVVWKLRDPRVPKVLTSSQASTGSPAQGRGVPAYGDARRAARAVRGEADRARRSIAADRAGRRRF